MGRRPIARTDRPPSSHEEPPMPEERWTTEPTGAWDLAGLLEAQRSSASPYLEFLRAPDLSVGLYVLEAGAVDGQSPHTEDEAYIVMSGRGRLRMGDDDVAVGPGSVAFVAAGVEHRFHDIDERLEILVAFGPAEGSREALPG
jgi:mannose-6-phosphate isomerase-like protein (cupin superfamily)